MSNIAVRTAGHGSKDDYTWKVLSEVDTNRHDSLVSLTDEDWSCAITRDELGFNLYLGGIQSKSNDYRGRINKVSVAYYEISETEARQLLILALQDPDDLTRKVITAFSWEDPSSEAGWSVDFEKLKDVIGFAASKSIIAPGCPPISDAWERSNTAETRIELANQVLRYSFSHDYGVKVVVSGAPQRYPKLIEEADHLLWDGATKRNLSDLRAKKKVLSSHSPSERSKTPSNSSLAPLDQSSSNLEEWISSKKILLIICGVVVVGVVLAGTFKKKDKEPADVKPPQEHPTGSPDPSVGITPKNSPQPEDLPATKAPEGGKPVEQPATGAQKP